MNYSSSGANRFESKDLVDGFTPNAAWSDRTELKGEFILIISKGKRNIVDD